MKIGIGNWARPFASAWRVVVFTLVVCATGQAWAAAPEPVAEWSGDLENGSVKSTKYTMSMGSSDSSVVAFINGNAILTSSRSVSSKGVQITWPDPTSDAESFTSKKMSVILQYSGLSILDGNTSLLSALWGGTSKEYMVRTTSNNGTAAIATGITGASSAGTQLAPSSTFPAPAQGKLLVCFSGDSSHRPGIDLYFSTYDSTSATYGDYRRVSYWSDQKVDNGTFYGLKIGGTIANTGKYYRPGMTVEAVQIYDTVVSASSTAISANTSWSSLVWDKDKPDFFPASLYTYIVNVTDDATLDLTGATIAAQSINFNIASGKTLTLEGTATITGASISVTGGGKLKLNTSNPGCAITVASGGTMDIAVATVSCAITNYGTMNVNGCSVTGVINNYGTIATSGTTSIQNASSQFYESGTLSVSGETTLRTANNTNNDTGGLRGRVIINENARLISNYSATPYYSASLTLDLYGELALGSGVRWVVGGNTTVNVYSGGSITGGDTTNGGLDWRAGGGVINAYATSTFTAGIRARDSQTITVNVEGSDVVFDAPIYSGSGNQNQTGTINKTGAGTFRTKGGSIKNKFSGTEGTIEITTTSSANTTSIFTGSTFSGVLKVTNTNGKQNNFDPSGAKCFADGVRPEFVMESTATYFSKSVYNGTPFYVRDLSGTSSAVLDARMTTGPISYTIDTLQTKDTEYLGIFNNNDGDDRTFALNVTGNNIGGVHTLTLSNSGNMSTNTLTVSNYAKVLFSSTGNWAKGVVVVGENGVLESQNSAAIAAKLKVEEGATLAFADGVQLKATAYDWSAVSNEGSVNIDLSDITPSDTPVTLIASDVEVTKDKFTVTDSPCYATLSVDNGALKATFANYWRDGTWGGATVANEDATLYISRDSTLTVSEALTLGTVTVVKEGEDDVTLTISGTGALATDGWTIPAGVTVVTADGMEISGDVTGGGIINVPANTTLTMDGVTTSGDTLADRVKVAVSGTLKTKGTTTLSAANTSAAGSLIEVVSGSTTLATEYRGIFGDITIGSAENGSAQLTMGASYRDGSDTGWDWLGQSSETCIDIYGTLTLGDRNLILYAGNSIKLHNGAIIEGSPSGTYASSYGSLAFLGNAPVQVDANATATINAHINSRTGFSPEFTIGENATLMVSQTFIGQTGTQHTGYYCGGSITKAGLGTLSLTGFAMTKPMTINAGKVVVDTAPTASSFAIAEGATFTLNTDLNSSVGEGQYTGAGTLELENLSGDKWYLQNINFSGIIKTKNAGGNYWIGGANSNGGFAPLFSGTPELIAESGTQLINRNFNAATLPIRDLSGGATITVGNYDSEDDANKTRTVSSKQTKNTTFSGVFASQGTCSTSLEVYGNTSAANLYALTLSGVNTTVGGLTVRDNAKVVFTSDGGWSRGKVWIRENGWLESSNSTASAVTQLTLADNSHIVFPTSSSSLAGITSLTFEEGATTYISFPNGAPDSGTIIDWTAVGSAPAGTFVLEGAAAETHILTKGVTGLAIAKAYGSVTTNSGTTPYASSTVLFSRAAAAALAKTLQYITIFSNDEISVPVYADAILIKNVGNATINIDVTAEFSVTDSTGLDGITTYTIANAATEYTWTDAYNSLGSWNATLGNFETTPNHEWGKPRNWSFDSGTIATRYPQAGDTVIINDHAEIVLSENAACARMELTGAGVVSADSVMTLTVSGDVVLSTVATTLELTKVTLSANSVTTDVEGKVVKWVVDGNTTTYTVVDPVAQIGDVKYGSLANAVEFAEAGDEITLLANTSVGSVGKAITLDIGAYTLTLTSAGALDSISSLKGTGTLVLPSDSLPTSSLQTLLKNSTNWNGTLALSGLAENTALGFNFSNYGNANSKIQLTNCWIKYLDNGSSYFEGCLVLCDDASNNPAFKTSDGYSDRYNKFGELAGNGTIYAKTRQLQMYSFLAASNFTGSVTIEGFYDTSAHKYDGRRIVFGEPPTPDTNGAIDSAADPASIRINPGVQVGLGEGAVWNASYGIYIGGTVIVNGNASLTSNKVLDHESDATPPNNLRGDKHIVFYGGAKLLYKKLCTVTTTGDVTLAKGSTVAIAFADGVSPVDGTQLISWSAPPAGTFAFDNGNGGTTDTLTVGEIVYTLSSENDGLYLRKAVAFTYDGAPPVICYYPSVAAALSAGTNIYLYDAPNETVTLEAGKTININGKDVSNLIVNSALDEYASPIAAENNAYSLANAASAPVTYYWTGATDSNWATKGNWKVNSSDGPVATRVVESTDSVVFNDGANVTHSASVTVAGITVNGAVSIGGAYSLETASPIMGSGTLTIADDTGLASVAPGVTVAPDVVFEDGTYIGCGTGGGAITFNGDVSLPAGEVKFWNAAHSFAGTTTLNGSFTKGGGQPLTLADVNVAASSTLSGAITITGNVTIDSGKSLGIPSSGVTYSGATFVGSGKVSFAAIPSSALRFNAWTGTVALPAFNASAGFDFRNYGISGSTVEIGGFASGWLTPYGDNNTTIAVAPNLILNGDMSLTAMSTRVYSFQTISGTGSFSVSGKQHTSMSIAKIGAGYEGTISNTSGKVLTITAVDMATVPAVGDRLLKVSGGNITISGVTVNGVATPLRWVRKTVEGVDGFYVISGTIFSVW